jgi:hypothetical protein
MFNVRSERFCGQWGHMAKKTATKGADKKKAPAMKYMQTRLTEPSWKELQMLRLERSDSMQSLVVEALNDLMVKYGRNTGSPARRKTKNRIPDGAARVAPERPDRTGLPRHPCGLRQAERSLNG